MAFHDRIHHDLQKTGVRRVKDCIALFCLTNLGDGVLISPLISALAECRPDRSLVLVAKPIVCELYAEDKRVAHFIPFTSPWLPGPGGTHDGLKGFYNVFRGVRGYRCSIGLNTFSHIKTELLARTAGIQRLISAHGRYGGVLSSEIVSPDLIFEHEADRQLKLASALMGKEIGKRPVGIQISGQDESIAVSLVGSIRNSFDHIAFMHPGANIAFKSWPAERFIEIGKYLTENKRCGLVIIGGPGPEEYLADGIVKSIGPNAFNLAGKTPPRVLLAALKGCDLFIGNDSGPMHLAAAAGCPTVGIFGATNPYRFGPYLPASLRRVIFHPSWTPETAGNACATGPELLSRISTRMVIEAIEQLLNNDSNDRRQQARKHH